jgi:hypothetical protein
LPLGDSYLSGMSHAFNLTWRANSKRWSKFALRL